MINMAAALNLEDSEADAFLEGIQGNVIKGHGRDFTRHILLKMTGDPAAVGRWIARFAAEHVTSAQASRRQRDAWRAHGGSGEPFAMFLLAPDGYRYLGQQLPSPGAGEFTRPEHERYFRVGMKGQPAEPPQSPQTAIRSDPPVQQWEPPYQQPIHAMVLLADDSPERLDESEAKVLASIDGILERLTVECGRKIKKAFPSPLGPAETVLKVIEHFGFQDGVSQPIMIRQDLEDEISKRGSSHWDPGAPLSLALAEEPGPARGRFGSFMAFRKLEQNVKGFREAIARLSSESGISPEDAGAMAVGRFENGEPALPNIAVIDPKADKNDFHFGSQDAGGQQCPFHAHIRKTDPRGDLPNSELERAKRIVRRGITYDERPDLDSGGDPELPSEGVGLLFMCFQSNLDQFVIQQEGSDSNNFARPGVGLDAVIGQFNGVGAPPKKQSWRTATGSFEFEMSNFVRMRGGEYFFAPSMSFLKGLVQI